MSCQENYLLEGNCLCWPPKGLPEAADQSLLRGQLHWPVSGLSVTTAPSTTPCSAWRPLPRNSTDGCQLPMTLWDSRRPGLHASSSSVDGKGRLRSHTSPSPLPAPLLCSRHRRRGGTGDEGAGAGLWARSSQVQTWALPPASSVILGQVTSSV